MKLKKIFSKLKTYILSSPKLLWGLILLFIIVLLVCAAPFLTSYSPTHLSDDLLVSPFTKGHFLGTTNMGEDVWSQILYGGRVSLKIGVVETCFKMKRKAISGTPAPLSELKKLP